MLEEIKKRRQECLDSIKNYVEGTHEKVRDEFLYWAEQDIDFLAKELEKLQQENERHKEGLKRVKHEYIQGLGKDVQKVCLKMHQVANESLKAGNE